MRCDTNEIQIQTNERQTYVARFYNIEMHIVRERVKFMCENG